MGAFSPACASPSCDIGFFSFPVYESMLTVEDGSIVAGADTFADADDVAAHATRYGLSWAGTDLEKEQAILRAMQFIESFEEYLQGSRVSAAQELSWPRNYVKDRLGTAYLANDAIPAGVISALAEAAIEELASPFSLLQTITHSSANVKRTRDKIGPMETEIEYSSSTNVSAKTYTRIINFLRPFFKAGAARYSVRGH